MADQLSRSALAMQGRRSLQSLRLRILLHALRPLTKLGEVLRLTLGVWQRVALLPPTKLEEALRRTLGVWQRVALLPPALPGEGWDGGKRYSRRPSPSVFVALACALSLPLTAQADNMAGKGVAPPKHKWTEFVQVKGQPEPVPAEWVSTPEGQFAHSIEIPNPVPKDSGYRWWWSAKKYFLHLCEKEAGEFVFKTVDNVEGFLFMRPPKRPTDFDMKDQFKLEAPSFERLFRPYRDAIASRGTGFVSPGRDYTFVEEPDTQQAAGRTRYIKGSAYDDKTFELSQLDHESLPASRYAVTWRGLRRPHDREHKIAGSEIIVLDTQRNEVLGVWREFGFAGSDFLGRDVWWLNAAICPKFYAKYKRPEVHQKYGFISSVLRPTRASDSR